MRNLEFGIGEYYHVYNRGVDKRNLVQDAHDADRFLRALEIFNNVEFFGSLAELDRCGESTHKSGPKLVEIVCYCLNPNHFHFVLKEIRKGGISKFMRKLSGGYSRYFNIRHKRSGTLFQGVFKAKHINDNDYLLHLSCYVNLNYKLHKIGNQVTELVRSSLVEYEEGIAGICDKNIVLDQFDSPREYKKFVLEQLPYMKSMRKVYDELKTVMFD